MRPSPPPDNSPSSVSSGAPALSGRFIFKHVNDQTKPPVWNIGLGVWIIQDGNYSDFAVGQMAQFAVEFYRKPTDGISQTSHPISTTLQKDSIYEVVAEKALQTEDLTILDIGVIVFREHDRNDESSLQGNRFRTKIYLGIDPYLLL
jgi:hypothetical protein